MKMVSFKDQRIRENARKVGKVMRRNAKNPRLPAVPVIVHGNKDRGVPFKGKDRFSGQLRKFADRSELMENGHIRLHYADNNKYNGDGSLKD